MVSNPEFSFSLSSPGIPSGGGPRLIYSLIKIYGGDQSGILPGNLGFVIDTSESMRIHLVTERQFTELVQKGHTQEVMTDGIPAFQISSIPSEMIAQLPRRIDYIASALHAASKILSDHDFFSLIAFASRAECLISQVIGKKRNQLQEAASRLETLQLGDGTQIDEGLALALELTNREPGKEFPTRLILMTDGHTQNVRECYQIAYQARQAGIKITTMGIGSEFNEDLLIPLSDLTGGNAYYIETLDQINDAFRRELGSALRISYRNLEIKLLLSQDVQLRRAYRVLPELGDFETGPVQDGSYALLFGDYAPSSEQAILIELVVEDGPPGVSRLAQAVLKWDDPNKDNRRQSIRQDIDIERSLHGLEQSNEQVMNFVDKVGIFKMGKFAMDAVQRALDNNNQQDIEAATLRLRQAATSMLDLGEVELAGELDQQATWMEKEGSLDLETAKKIRYRTRRLSQN